MKLKSILIEVESIGSLLGKKINGKLITADTKNEKWEGDFNCHNNQLTSLEHAPTSVSGDFSCYKNQLTSLEHAPASVGGNFYCHTNQLTSLRNVHKFVKQIDGTFYCRDNPITSHVLGVLLIKGCTKLLFRNDVDRIINKYLPNTRGMAAVNECQDKLIEADLEDFAEL